MANNTVYPYGTGGSLPASVGIINDPYTGGTDKAFSAEQGKVLNNTLNSPSEINVSPITEVGAFITIGGTWTVNYQNYKGKFMRVCPGDKYVIKGNGTNYSLCAILKTASYSQGDTPDYATDQSRFTVGKNQFYSITIPKDGFVLWFATYSDVDLSPASITIVEGLYTNRETDKLLQYELDLADYPAIRAYPTNTGVWNTNNDTYPYYGIFIPCNGGERFNVTSKSSSAVYYTFLKSKDLSASVDWASGFSGMAPPWTRRGFSVLIAPNDAKYLYIVASWDGLTNSILPDSVCKVSNVFLNTPSATVNTFPTILKLGENTSVIYTRDNTVIRYGKEDDTDYLYLSKDLGETWTAMENTLGDVTHVHLFLDGTILLCTAQACYYTKDFVTVTESTVYDYDGSASVPSGIRFYSIPKVHSERIIIDGTEWHLFWDYILTTTNPRIWYSNDNGKTVRSAFAFGLQQINGSTISARHVHDFDYDKSTGKFYVFTGDSTSEVHVMRGSYNNGSFTWEKLKTGGEYKLTSVDFHDGYFFAVTDYTEQSLEDKKGILICPTNDIDSDNFEYLFKATAAFMGQAALSTYCADRNGWRVCSTDYQGGSKTLIAKNGFNFVWVENSRSVRLWSMVGPNNAGEIYSHISSTVSSGGGSGNVNTESWLKLNLPSCNLTKAMRDSGARDFFDYKISDY